MTLEQALADAKKAASRGDVTRAVQLYQAILHQRPDHPVAKKAMRRLRKRAHVEPPRDLVTTAAALFQEGRLADAEQYCKKQLKSFPNSVLLLNILGSAQHRAFDPAGAVQSLSKALSLKPDFAVGYNNRANALKDMARTEAALADYDHAIELQPDYIEAHYNRANLLKDMGRFSEARQGYEQALRLRPDFAPAHRALSTIRTYVPDDEHPGSMETLLADETVTDSSRVELHFALAKAYDDLNDQEQFARHLQAGNRLQKRILGYDLERDRDLFERIQALYPEWPTDTARQRARKSAKPIFIVGMMRSGTSLVEQILASHHAVFGAGELESMNLVMARLLAAGSERPLQADDIVRARQAYDDRLRDFDFSEKTVTDKMPLNFRWVGFMLKLFPDAKIIHLERDPMATCWSIYRHYFPDAGNAYAYDMTDIVGYYHLYTALMKFWNDQFPEQIYNLSYERLTENPEAEIRRLLDFCDLDFDDNCLSFHKSERLVKTVSGAQVRQEMFTGSSRNWEKYRDLAEPLVRELGKFGLR